MQRKKSPKLSFTSPLSGDPRWMMLKRRDWSKITDILQTTFEWVFLNEMFKFLFQFHWSFFLRVQLTSHNLSQWWPRFLAHICVSRPRSVINTLRPGQNGRHFADDIFKCIFLDENVWIPIKISLKFVPKVPINDIPALVQIMAWLRPGDN